MQPPVPVLAVVTFPPGATKTQARIVIDGVRGAIFVYKAGGPAGALIGSWAGSAGTDPYGNAYPQGINVNLGVIQGVQIISGGIGAEILVYSSTPAANNLILSVSSADFVDAHGNHGLQGFAYYTSTIAYQLTAAGIQHYNGVMQTGWGTPNQVIAMTSALTNLESPNIVRVTINGFEIADFTASGLYITPGVTFQTQVATPTPSPAGNPIMFANQSGIMLVNDAGDGTTYDIQTRTLSLSANSGSISSSTPTGIGLNSPVSARTYWVRAKLFITTTSTPQFGYRFNLPNGGSGQTGAAIYRAATFTGSVAGGPNTNLGIAIALAAGVTYQVDISGMITASAVDTLSLQVYDVTGGTGSYIVLAASALHISPV